MSGAGRWAAVRPELAATLTDERLQLHYAAQFATAAGISYLTALPDDSHTNLEWVPRLGALLSRSIAARTPFHVGVRIADLTLLFTDATQAVGATFALKGHTIADGADWIAEQVSAAGADATRFTLKRHYELPAHAVATGAPFAVERAESFAELSTWFSNAALMLGNLAAANRDASEVRCWPHHFDIATLIELDGGRTIGAGLEPGDGYYAEPYFYVNLRPAPSAAAVVTALAGGGSWHTREWVGAVLPGSRIKGAARGQEAQVRAFLESAVAACRSLLSAG